MSSWHTPGGYVRNEYFAEEIDLVAASCWKHQLRLSPPKNGQIAAIHFATQYEFPGAIAQLGERLHGMQEVAGSSPASSTSQADDSAAPETVVGADRSRNLFGHFMERAAAGESILVTRRGRPTVRLTPAAARPSLARAPHQVAATASMTDPAPT